MDGWLHPGALRRGGEVSSFFLVSSFHKLSIDAAARLFVLERNTAEGRCHEGLVFRSVGRQRGRRRLRFRTPGRVGAARGGHEGRGGTEDVERELDR
jgi:hypothetical protein